ncbi:MAG TPA: hypothetical protein VJH22_01250 [Candidatus Nanoarchaeia archaeon]|nr:hypothetical protein [Candidatus Nanoarchaeia archaeon]
MTSVDSNPHTKPSLPQRLASAGITGAATLGGLLVGTELYQFSTIPDPHFSPDYLKLAVPLATAAVAATNPGLALYRGAGFLVEQAGRLAYAPHP